MEDGWRKKQSTGYIQRHLELISKLSTTTHFPKNICATMTEVELQLKLDPKGRTISEQTSDSTQTLDYSSKTVLTSLADDSNHILFPEDEEKRTNFLDEMLLDCEITDCALLPRTFWMPAVGMEPRCVLEQCALEVFRHHVKDGIVFDPKTSGAEWWVQIRPSPPAGRHALLPKEDERDAGEVDLETTGICFHWDKDEDLRLAMGGNMYIHPHVSTVTYLSDSGAPTMALNYRVNPFTGEYISPSESESVDAYLSWPKKGKHLSFDGGYLHAAPSNLMQDGAFQEQIKVSDEIKDKDERKKLVRRQRRVTFLVNVWLNYKPFNVEIFPESMMDKMTLTSDEASSILFKDESDGVKYDNCSTKVQTHDRSCKENKSFKWSMGGCGSNESISMDVAVEPIQMQMRDGGNTLLKWNYEAGVGREGVRLIQEGKSIGAGKESQQESSPGIERDEKRQKLE